MADRNDMGASLGRGPESEPKTIDELAEEKRQRESREATERIAAPESAPVAPESPRQKEVAREAVEQATKEQEVQRERERVDAMEDKGKPSGKGPAVSQLPEDLQDDIFLQQFMTSDRPQQIKTLVVITLKKGVRHAIKLAQSSKDPYLMDIFHDTLVDELHDHLVQNKKLKDQ